MNGVDIYFFPILVRFLCGALIKENIIRVSKEGNKLDKKHIKDDIQRRINN